MYGVNTALIPNGLIHYINESRRMYEAILTTSASPGVPLCMDRGW